MGGLAAENGHCAISAAVGAGSDSRGVGGVKRIAGAAVGEGWSGVVHVGEGGPCDEGGNDECP